MTKPAIGTFERNIHGWFIYKTGNGYYAYRAQDMFGGTMCVFLPSYINIWQSQLYIWMLATGFVK